MQAQTLNKPVANGAIAPGAVSPRMKLPDGANIRFIEDAEQHPKASEIAGAPRFVRVISAIISRPANRNSEFSLECARVFPEELRQGWTGSMFRQVKESPELDVKRAVVDPRTNQVLDEYSLRRFYEAYMNATEMAEVGTPLEVWSAIKPHQVAQLKYQEIATVEQLASVGDNFLASLGHAGRSLRDKARAYMANTTGDSAKIQAIIDRQDRMETEIKAKDEEIAQLRAALSARGATPATETPVEAPTNTVRRGGRRTAAKADDTESDVAAEIRAAAAGDEDPDFV